MSGYHRDSTESSGRNRDRYGTTEDDSSSGVGRHYRPQDEDSDELQRPLDGGRRPRNNPATDDIFRDESASFDGSEGGYEMSLSELLYSTSSFYAIAIPGE